MSAAIPHVAEPLVHGYLTAKRLVIEAGYSGDIDWAEGLAKVKPDAEYVLREGAWVIVNSGFRYAVARKLWPRLREAFGEFQPGRVTPACMPAALRILNSPRKIGAIVDLAAIVDTPGGWEGIVDDARLPPSLMRLAYIGKVTCWHYAKVLGVDCVKPDVHLVRAAQAAGYLSPTELCRDLRDRLGDRLTVCDSVLWRYGEQQKARGWLEWPALWKGRAS